jgi:hypothetical protein
MTQFSERLFPPALTKLERIRAGLVIVTALAIFAALAALILYWILTGVLETPWTIVTGLIFGGLLLSIAGLARNGRVELAAWLLLALLLLAILADLTGYGIESLSASGLIVPILLAAMTLGLKPALAVALFCSLGIWTVALLAAQGIFTPYNESMITFTAPALTLLFFLVAFMVGWWHNATLNVIPEH